MGLRGLAFPSSIGQLGAIFIMALVRSGIRRRLGHPVTNCPATQWYEIDFLAARTVLYPKGRVFDNRSGEEDTSEPEDYLVWKINTPNLRHTTPFLVPLEPEAAVDPKTLSTVETGYQSLESLPTSGHIIKEPTSQQLLRVRKRLGDLTEWKTRSSASAIALVQSIRLVMDTFLPGSKDKSESLKSLTWLLRVTFPQSIERQDLIKVPITLNKSRNKSGNKSNSKWELDTGLIDAALSLWMASIDAKMSNAANETRGKKPPLNYKKHDDSENHIASSTTDWIFNKDEDALNYSFYRIIGDNLEDGVLKRDISWWTDSLSIEEIKPKEEIRRDEELIIGFNGIENEDESRSHQ